MYDKQSLTVIGGDSRQIYAAEHLIKLGYKVRIFACELENISEKKNYCFNLQEATESKNILLPLPFSRNNKTINSPLSESDINIQDFINYICDEHNIFLGLGANTIIKQLKAKTINTYDYYTVESLIHKNALLTAEGLIGIITEKLPVTIFGLRVGITGYGRISYYTTKMLHSLNADVTVFARDRLQLTKAQYNGIKIKHISSLKDSISDFECIINTVPEQIIDKDIINNSQTDCLFIEAASSPYGIDAVACTQKNRNLVKAYSLPGKTSPKSAGIIIADTVHDIIKEVDNEKI